MKAWTEFAVPVCYTGSEIVVFYKPRYNILLLKIYRLKGCINRVKIKKTPAKILIRSVIIYFYDFSSILLIFLNNFLEFFQLYKLKVNP